MRARADAGDRSTRSSGAEFREDRPRWRARRRSTPRSNTRRCTRRRCSTCGIGCRYEQKRKPASLQYELDRGTAARAVARSVRIPAGTATLGADREPHPVRMGQRVRRAPGRRARLRHRRAQRDERGVPGIRRRRAATATQACGQLRTGRGCRRKACEHPAFWIDGDDGAVVLARDVRGDSAAAAWPVYVSQAEACRIRAMEGTPPADRSGIPSRRVRDPVGRGARLSLG